jgi:glycosyltransferase involved in cell wall biosynthesis
MKALVHNPYWDTLGGGERYSAALIRLLLNTGWQVYLDWPDDLTPGIKSRFDIDISGVSFISKANLPDFDLVFWVSDGSLPISFSKRTIIHFQFPFQSVNGHSFPNFIKSRFYTFVVNSAFTKTHIDREFNIHSHVIYPPIDTQKFTPSDKIPQILYVGRFSQLTQRKNQDLLIETFDKLSPKIPGWKLIITGGIDVGVETEYLNKLRNSAKSLPVEIITNPTFDQLRILYSQSSLFWSASGYSISGPADPIHVEHFGISVVEAMAAGCVPIISDFGGHREIVSPGEDGFLWSQPEQLITHTLKLIKTPKLMHQLSKQAINKSKIFNVERFNQAFIQLIKHV